MSQDTFEVYTTRLIPLVDWPKYHPWPPIGGLRHMVFHAKKTGFSKVIKKVNRRILIDEREFFEFIRKRTRNHPRYLTKR